MIWPTKVKSDDGKTFYTDEAAPTQGADARPVAIYQVNEGCVRTGDLWRDVAEASYAPLRARGYQGRIVYATRDTVPSSSNLKE